MGNRNSSIHGFKAVFSPCMGGSSEAECVVGTAAEDAPSSSAPQVCARSGSGSNVVEKATETESGGNGSSSVEQPIEASRSNWSLLSELDSTLELEEVNADNRAVFKELQSHPQWGHFFSTFGYTLETPVPGRPGFILGSSGSLEIGEKFAEGGHAELFHAHITWQNPKKNEWDREHGRQWVLKVFKEGTLLRHLQSQWPHGMLQFEIEEVENWMSSTPKRFPRYYCSVQRGTLLKDGRFAFLMKREAHDLRSLINQNIVMTSRKNCGPFSKEHVEEIMWAIALGMSWLHSRNIVHRDLKASNVLVYVRKCGLFQCFVADYECSVGVIGTGFFRAPEILEACKDKSVSRRPELFTKSSDVYSYGMTCYEVLTGKLPFEGHQGNDYDLILNGARPKVPEYVDDWICGLLRKCWQSNPRDRTSFGEILNSILVNSIYIRKLVIEGKYILSELEWVKWEVQEAFNF